MLGKKPFESTEDFHVQGAEVTSAGLVVMFDTETGEPSVTNKNMLGNHLRKVRGNGKRVWTVRDPGFRPKVGAFKCRLHGDHPDRSAYGDIGLPVCKKSSLASLFEVEEHGRKKHRREWAAMQDADARREREEERQFQRDQQAFMGRAFASSAPAVAEAVARPEVEAAPEPEPDTDPDFEVRNIYVKKCEVCGKEYVGPEKHRLNLQMRPHLRAHTKRGEMPPAKE